MDRVTFILAVIFIITLNFNSVVMHEMNFDRIELVNSTYLEGVYNFSLFRINKFNRTTHAINLEFELYVDIDEQFEIAVSFYYNRLNNNQYSKSVMRVPRSSLCGCVEKYNSILVTDEMKNHTNLLLLKPNGKWCPVKSVSNSN